ncbi:MAG: phospholipid carrier-dependent glycosyltransferase [Eubacteriales bacterium]
MNKRLLFIIAIIIILAIPTSVFGVTGNHVVNGDFEETDYIQTDWEVTIENSSDDSSSVSFFAADNNVYAKITADKADYISLKQSVFLEANSTFKISAMMRATNIGIENAGGYMRLEAGQGQSAQLKGTLEGWQQITFYVTTSEDDVYTTLEVALGDTKSQNSGVLFVDDISIVQVSEIPVGVNHTVIAASEKVEATQQPEQKTVKNAASILSERERIAIIMLLFATVIFMFLVSWMGSQNNSALEKTIFINRGSKAIMAAAFLLIVLFKYYVATLGTDLGSDIGAYIKWSKSLATGGIRYFYVNTNCMYPCGYMYVLWFVGKIGMLLDVGFKSTSFNLMLKTPVILCELATAYLAYRIAKKQLGEKNATIISLVVLLNPAVLMNTSSWGQVDAVYILAIVFVFYLLEQKHSYLAAGFFAFSLLLKTQAILFLPVFGAYYLQLFLRNKSVQENLKEFFISIGVALLTYWLISMPYMADEGIFWQFKQIGTSANHFGYVSLNGFNFYTLFGGNYTVVTDKFVIFSYQSWGYFFIVLSSIIAVLLVFFNRKKQALFLIAAFMIGAVFTFGHGMHERYIMPLPILLFFAYIYIKDTRIINLGILYTIFALLSQAAVLFFYGESFYKVIVFCMSVFSLLNFGYLAYVCYILLFKKGTTIKRIDQNRPEEIKRKTEQANAKIIERIKRRAAKRLHTRVTISRINKHDRLIIILLTLVYAIIAFINLGDFKIVDSAWQPKVAGETVIFELEESTRVDMIKYYFGLGSTKMHITASEDGETYYEVPRDSDEDGQFVVDFNGFKIYSWQFVKSGFNAKYIAIEFSKENVDVRELGFIGDGGNVLPVKSISSNVSGAEELAPIIDEQYMIPDETSYMSSMYFDEIYHARTALEMIEHRNIYEITHPPLGKILISIGIRIFGMTPFGWRFMGTLAGIFMIPLMYVLSKRITKRTLFASIATVLLTFDFMHFAQTRISTIDSYSVIFILLMFLFMYDYTSMNFNRDKLYKTFVPLGLTGIFFGLGAATKWLCLYAGAGLAVIFFYTLFLRYREYEAAKLRLEDNTAGKHEKYYKSVVSTFYYKLFLTLLFCVIMFIIIPAIIYYLSYIPYMRIENHPYDFHAIMKNQSYMWNYHAHLTVAKPHPFSSKWYTWFLDIRPVYFFQGTGYAEGTLSSLSSFGNPIIWWALIPSAVGLIILRANHGKLARGLNYSIVAGLSNIVPWIFISRETYIYHYFATVPFMILVVTFALKYLFERTKYGKYFVLGFLVLVVVAFIMFYPFITGITTTKVYANAMRWLDTWPFY